MGLTDREKRALDEIELHLAEDDPRFAARLTRPSPLAFPTGKSVRVLGVLICYFVGLFALMTGVTWSSVPLIVLGAALCASVFAGLVVRAWRDRQV